MILVSRMRARLSENESRLQGDSGATLMEMMVGMILMTIFMGIFTGSVVSMFQTSNKVQAVENTSAQLNAAFERLDNQVRYAVAIDPILNSPYPSVAFQTVNPPTATVAAVTTCTQLEVRPVGTTAPAGTPVQQLAERTWSLSVNGAVITSTVSSWNQLANNVVLINSAGATVPPFTVLPATSGTVVQRLQLQLRTLDGVSSAATYSSSQITFTALNASAVVGAALCPAPDNT